MTIQEQKLKLKLADHINEFFESDEWADGTIGIVPENVTELMADAAFGILLAAQGTNKYRDENPD